MNKFVLASLMLVPCFVQAEDHPSCVSETQYVMQFLAKSGTSWLGFKGWEEKKEPAVTNYLATIYDEELKETSGVLVKIHDLYRKVRKASSNTLQGTFRISYKNGNVVIESEIVDIEVRKNISRCELAQIQEGASNYHGKKVSDEFTESEQRCDVEVDEATNTTRVTLRTTAKTVISESQFREQIKKKKDGF